MDEIVNCPLCGEKEFQPWGSENGYQCVRCTRCRLLYVNPRPCQGSIDKGVLLGVHHGESLNLNVVGRRVASKVPQYRKVLYDNFPEFRDRQQPVDWLDVGAGFGEFVEALTACLPAGSNCEGIEPMAPKAQSARDRGLRVREAFLSEVTEKYDVVSIFDILSHVPNFHSFLQEIRAVLRPNGEVFIKTGNAADVGPRDRVPEPLTLPDHLVFAGESHIRRFLTEGGFDVVSLRACRVDGLVYSARNLVKWVLRRPVRLGVPYTSELRVLYIRARLR